MDADEHHAHYAFGSVCRGELDDGSDTDLLACMGTDAAHVDHRAYSVYRYQRLRELWEEGNPFAWHLHLESRLIFTADGTDFLRDLGLPNPYMAWETDYAKFRTLFEQSWSELKRGANSATFHLGHGKRLSREEIEKAIEAAVLVPHWVHTLRNLHKRIQQQN